MSKRGGGGAHSVSHRGKTCTARATHGTPSYCHLGARCHQALSSVATFPCGRPPSPSRFSSAKAPVPGLSGGWEVEGAMLPLVRTSAAGPTPAEPRAFPHMQTARRDPCAIVRHQYWGFGGGGLAQGLGI